MPIFEGEDAYGWVYRVERYFCHQWTLRKGKIDGGGVMFGGKGPCAVSMARTTKTVEDRMVMEYKEKFELLLGRLWGIPEAVLEGNFMKGLKPEIRASLRLLRPRGLGESMELAQMVEDENTVEWVHRINSVNFSYQNSTPLRDSQRDWDSGARLGVTFERLMETEIQDKRAKGLCFRCYEKFSSGHRCKDKSLQVLIVCDEEEGWKEAKEEDASVTVAAGMRVGDEQQWQIRFVKDEQQQQRGRDSKDEQQQQQGRHF
ncbi:hypothetical protein WN944_019661 [Citrus x changshan-huyou]|uniref:Uncharacterized protein n=1 Tax=Citrus x changshan-huyou TaxID=2935761 RepID=A0AAP0LZ01_9ROSI